MHSNKLIQIRSTLRKAQIQQHFATKRRQLVYGKQGLAQELFQEVNQQAEGQTNIHLVGKLLAYHKEKPSQQNTYVLISNYLVDQPQDLRYFYHPILNQPRCLEHYMWCLTVIAMTLNRSLQTQDKVQIFEVRQQMGELIDIASNLLAELFVNLKSNNQKSQKEINMWQYYVQMIKIVLASQILEEFPQRPAQLFVSGLSYFKPHQSQHGTILHTWKCMTTIITSYSNKLQNKLRQNIIEECGYIFEIILREMPLLRLECIQLLQTIICQFPVDFTSLVYTQSLMKQLLFILKEMPSLKSSSTRLVKFIVQQCNVENLLLLLQLGAHTILTQTMEWSMNVGNNGCLEDCLITLYNILNSLKSSDEKRLLFRVKSEMQCANFDMMIQGLSRNSQTDKIWRYLTFIIDDFYSEESC